jgi:hypothetical protein
MTEAIWIDGEDTLLLDDPCMALIVPKVSAEGERPMTAPRDAARGWMLVPMAALYAVCFLDWFVLYHPPGLGEWLVFTVLAFLLLLPPFILGWMVGWGVGRRGE